MSASPYRSFEPSAEDIHIPPIPATIYPFIEKVWTSFVNKVVSLNFSNYRYCFEHSVFEAIQGHFLKIAVACSQYAMKDLVNQTTTPKAFKQFIARTRPTHVDDDLNGSATIIRQAIIDRAGDESPLIEEMDLRRDERIHPKLRRLLTPSMNYGSCITLFAKSQPIGLLWGIREKPLTDEQSKEVQWQLTVLQEGISNIVSRQLDLERDDYVARRLIEKIDANSKITRIILKKQRPGIPPVTSLYAYSHRFEKKYRMDTSYRVPTSKGFSVCLKQYLPEEENGTGKNLLMIPGFFCNRSAMDRLAREMALRYGYRVFSLNVRGRAKHTLPSRNRHMKNWTVDDYVCEDFPVALQWINAHFPEEKTVVVGHSMGGMIAKFYTGSYQAIKLHSEMTVLPDPQSMLAGIISISTPSYINLKVDNTGFRLFNKGTRLLYLNAMGRMFKKLFFTAVPPGMNTIDLNRFFTLLHNFTNSTRLYSFNMGRKVPTIKDFIGYEQITPPEWYFLMEDVFCKESLKVIFQFVRSQIGNNSFRSFDNKINYTEDLRNVRLPVFDVLGTDDTLAPPSSVLHGLKRMQSENKQQMYFKQGHLGIIMHWRTLREIGEGTNAWIRNL